MELMSLYSWYVENQSWAVPLTINAPVYAIVGLKAFQKTQPYLMVFLGVMLAAFTLGWIKRSDVKDDLFQDMIDNIGKAMLQPDGKTLLFKKTEYKPRGKVFVDNQPVELSWGEWWCMGSAYNTRLEQEKLRIRTNRRLSAATGQA